jgi:acyl-coenzyme A synthetase/AMP-(fatty) acid ligase
VLHSHQSYPVGHLSTMYWIGLKPGDVHWNISSPGWAKHAWSCFFAPWNAGATIFIYNYARFNAPAALEVLVQQQGDLAVRAAHRVAHADAAGSGKYKTGRCASWWAPASR